MEDNARPFAAVQIGMTSAETGTERFTIDGRTERMQVASWRVNLTALSQRHNLYFIASAHQVLVYEPEFPFQRLGRRPQLTITPQLANAKANGYIQPQRPHCINHLMVGNLGHKEILLFSTDSGNVVAYYTSAILNAIRKEPTRFSESAQAEYVGLRPFFSQWVFESAWGLAIHGEARMIAVSANTPYHVDSDDRASKITVFAFALCANDSDETVDGGQSDSDTDSTSRHLDWTPWVSTSNSGNVSSDPSTRDRNYKIVLAGVDGHTNNIPCIAFINGSQDPEGSWLLSTDIHGEIKLWRIWKGRCLRTWNFSDRGSIGAAWLRRYEAGWLVAALDINSFRPAETNDTFVGHRRAPQYYGYDAAGASYDLTNVVRQHVPSNSIYHPVNSDIDDGDSLSEPDALYEDMSDSEVTADEEETARVRKIVAELSLTPSMFSRSAEMARPATTASTFLNHPNIGAISVRTNHAMADGELESEDEDSDVYVEESDEETDMQVQIESDFSDDEMSDIDGHGGSTASPPSTASLSSYKDRHNNDSPGSSSRSHHGSKRSSPTGLVAADGVRGNKIEIPDVPFIHCSTSHLRMFSGTETKSPHIFCARILKQVLAPEMEGMQVVQMDRLSMIEQIPELGIIVIASQVGRCAICTLTRRQSDGLPGLRVDWILPTKKEERAGVRPVEHPLLGIATGPIQGRFVKESVPLSENDSQDHWAMDRIIDGTPTTFDDKVVDMDVQDGCSSEDSSTEDNIDRIFLTSKQYGKGISGSSLPSHVPLRPHKWPNTEGNEDWMAMESSRRYRLMMTYGDSTVLTYELSRGVEKEDQDTHVQVT